MRRPDWEARLRQTLANYEAASFEWGVSDCGTFAQDIAEAVAGRRPRTLRERYWSPRSWYRAARAEGYSTLPMAVAGMLEPMGWAPVPPMFAPCGSIGVAGLACAVRMPAGFVGLNASGGFAIADNITHSWTI